jgi:hypothetical protein
MAGTYYKYAERDADSQINWAEVGAEASGMLLEVNRVREEKKDALAQAQRESLNNLMNSPQGKNQDVNGVMNKFAHDLIAQKKIDYDLLTRGEMSVRDYTLKAQNQMDGTNRVFEIGKQLQATRQATLDGIADGTLSTSINVFNRGMVEEYQDMSKLGINVNSPDGSINLGIYEDKIVDGKNVRVLSNNIATPNVILGKVAQTVPAFDMNKANDNYTKGLGSKKDYWYEAATTAGAGTITELTGVQFLQNLTRPSDIAIVKNINDSINNQVASYFEDENKLFDVLGDKLGKYDENSFTFNKDIADADESKILVMVNPSTGMTSFDKTGKNYKKQLAQASEFARTDILAKMDAERKISTVGQLEESSATKARNAAKYAPKEGKEAPPAVVLTTPQFTKGFEVINGKRVAVDGAVSGLQNLFINEAKGVQNVAKSIGYNKKTGALELRGYQASGKETEGTTLTEGGSGISEGKSVVKQTPFVSSNIKNSILLSQFVPMIPNPEDPYGGNFKSVAQALDYFKRVAENKVGSTQTSNNTKSNNDPLGLGL